jgi:protein ImuA
MQIVSCHQGKLLKVDSTDLGTASSGRSFATGLEAVDRLLPGGCWGRGVIHEILWTAKQSRPLFFAAWLARAAMGQEARGGSVVWCDPRGEIYPPALASAGMPLERLFLLRPKSSEEEIWALGECLGCKGVAVTLAQPPMLSRIAARRLQLAAERGGGVGLLLRPQVGCIHHAAATRWLVEPARGERTVQRWKIQLIHGHGGLLHRPVYLEYSRDPYASQAHRVRATDQLGDRTTAEASRVATG